MRNLEKIYYAVVSASWFKQWPNKKVTKIEIFYAWMSIAAFFGGIGLGYDVKRGQEFSDVYQILLGMFILGMLLRVGSKFYKVSKEVQDHFWETLLMRFLDPAYSQEFKDYPHSSEKLRELKLMWFSKYGVSVMWVRENFPFWMKIQWVLCVGMGILGVVIGQII